MPRGGGIISGDVWDLEAVKRFASLCIAPHVNHMVWWITIKISAGSEIKCQEVALKDTSAEETIYVLHMPLHVDTHSSAYLIPLSL